MMKSTVWLLAWALLAHPVAAQTPAAIGIDTLALRAHTYFLSSDLLLGRNTGTRGERIAAEYIAAQLQRMGLRPASSGSWLQPVPLRSGIIDNAMTLATVVRGSDTLVFGSSRDFVWNTGGARAFRDFAGAAVFVGAAEVAGAVAGDDVRGKVLVVAGTLGALASELVPRWSAAGVAGVILLTDSAQFALYARSRAGVRLFSAADVHDPIWQADLPMLIAAPAFVRALLTQAPLTEAMFDGRSTFQRVDLQRTVSAQLRMETRDVAAVNVAGVIPGRDPALVNEYVVYTAHYDHLGVSTPDGRGDSIYNGFSDNAAGVAMLLAIGQAFLAAPAERSVMLLFLTGEERGLLGSTSYTVAPLVPLTRTVAVINLDAGAPPAPPRNWRIAGGTRSTLGDIAKRVATRRGWDATLSDASPNSDYWPFLRAGVPAIFIVPGNEWEGVTSEQRDALRRRWDRYHQPDDEWSQDFPFAGLARYADYALAIGRAVSAAPRQ
jgi:Zn-dependent M28 family amino/carboxypeptidase